VYSKTPTGKASKGTVAVVTSNGRLQLRFRHAGERHYVSIGLPDSPEGRKLPEMKAREIELDILSGNFDQTLAKYKPLPVNAQLSNLLGAIQPTPADPDALVFPSRESQFIDWHNFTNRAWAKVMASLPEIEYRNPYQTRHTFCSLCREADIPSIQIAKWLGNSAQMIDRVYAKPTDHIQVPEL